MLSMGMGDDLLRKRMKALSGNNNYPDDTNRDSPAGVKFLWGVSVAIYNKVIRGIG